MKKVFLVHRSKTNSQISFKIIYIIFFIIYSELF